MGDLWYGKLGLGASYYWFSVCLMATTIITGLPTLSGVIERNLAPDLRDFTLAATLAFALPLASLHQMRIQMVNSQTS